jgi:hypothetical protein
MRHLGVLTRRLDLRGEEGLALVMVMGVLIFFSIVTVTAYTMSNSTQSTASISSGGQNSYALAETGLNAALSTLEDVPTNDPLIASDISIGVGTDFYAWPTLGNNLPGVNTGPAQYSLALGPQSA